MNWYLFHTQDMPNTVDTYIDRRIKKMERLLATLNLYLDAELGIEAQKVEIPQEDSLDNGAEDNFVDFNNDEPKENA
jgi:hypothetical protein